MMHRFLFVMASVEAVIDGAPDWRMLSGEYKLYCQVGDQIEAEYEKLHPDGSITRKVASGDINKGLTYNNYQIDPEGQMCQLEGPGSAPPVDHLGPAGFSWYPREARVARWKPETPRMLDVKLTKNPLKNLFKDIIS